MKSNYTGPPGLKAQDFRWILRERMRPDHWYDLADIYQMVLAEEDAVSVVDEELVPGKTFPRWKRNLGAVLQKWKRTDELDWDGHARYCLRRLRT